MVNLLKKLTLKNQFIVIFISFFLLGSGVIGYYGYQSTKDAYTTDAINKSQDDLKLLKESTSLFLESIPSDLEFLADFYAFKQYLNWLNVNDEDKLLDSQTIVENAFSSFLKNKKIFYKLRFLDLKGFELINLEYNQQTAQVIKVPVLQNKSTKDYFQKALDMQKGHFYVSNMNFNKEFGKLTKPHLPIIRFSMPVFKGDDKVGVLVMNVYINSIIERILKNNSEYRKYILIDTQGNYIVHENIAKTFAKDLGKEDNFFNEFKSLKQILDKKQNIFLINDANIIISQKVLPPNQNSENYWTLISFVDKNFALKKVDNFTNIFILILLSTIILVTVVIYTFMSSITRPLNQVTQQLKNLSIGIVEREDIDYKHSDEIGYMIDSVKLLKQNTNELVTHSKNISQGNFEETLDLRSNEDIITKSLNNMSHTLKTSYEKNIEETWVNEGINNLSQKLSGEKLVQEITEETLKFTIPYIRAAKGCLFLYDKKSEELTLSSSYAQDNENLISQTYKKGEGLIGQVAKDQNVIIHNEKNMNPIIHSALINEQAKGHIVIPLVHENNLLGVIEISSLHPISKTVKNFIIEIEDIIATYLYAATKNEEIKKLLKESQKNAEELFEQRGELEETNTELLAIQRNLNEQRHYLETVLKKTSDSIEYASLIQNTLIPTNELLSEYFNSHFALWEQKDMVGGDIYLFEELRHKDECLLMVIDCTGHGVPGAFVTMLVKAIERQVIGLINTDFTMDVSPAWILQYFNRTMKQLLKQEDAKSLSNVGLDGQILYYNKQENIVKFASARNDVFIVQNNNVEMLKGNRHSVGYKDSDIKYKFTDHIINTRKNDIIYLSSDGYWDQLGGEKDLCFGKKRLLRVIDTIKDEPMDIQKQKLVNELKTYQGNHERNDDITVIGIKF